MKGNNATKNNRVSRFMVFPLFNIASTPVFVQALTPLFNAGIASLPLIKMTSAATPWFVKKPFLYASGYVM